MCPSLRTKHIGKLSRKLWARVSWGQRQNPHQQPFSAPLILMSVSGQFERLPSAGGRFLASLHRNTEWATWEKGVGTRGLLSRYEAKPRQPGAIFNGALKCRGETKLLLSCGQQMME